MKQYKVLLSKDLPNFIVEDFLKGIKYPVNNISYFYNIGTREDGGILIQGDIYTEGSTYEVHNWFIDQGCEGETILVFYYDLEKGINLGELTKQ